MKITRTLLEFLEIFWATKWFIGFYMKAANCDPIVTSLKWHKIAGLCEEVVFCGQVESIEFETFFFLSFEKFQRQEDNWKFYHIFRTFESFNFRSTSHCTFVRIELSNILSAILACDKVNISFVSVLPISCFKSNNVFLSLFWRRSFQSANRRRNWGQTTQHQIKSRTNSIHHENDVYGDAEIVVESAYEIGDTIADVHAYHLTN